MNEIATARIESGSMQNSDNTPGVVTLKSECSVIVRAAVRSGIE